MPTPLHWRALADGKRRRDSPTHDDLLMITREGRCALPIDARNYRAELAARAEAELARVRTQVELNRSETERLTGPHCPSLPNPAYNP